MAIILVLTAWAVSLVPGMGKGGRGNSSKARHRVDRAASSSISSRVEVMRGLRGILRLPQLLLRLRRGWLGIVWWRV